VDANRGAHGTSGLLESLEAREADIINLRFHLDAPARRLLYRSADAVLANSGHEPFGLVGLETMAVGGLACTGGTGEDYAVPGWNALVLQSTSPEEFVALYGGLQNSPDEMRAMRRRGQWTARRHTWSSIVRRCFFPRVTPTGAALDGTTKPGGERPSPAPRERSWRWSPTPGSRRSERRTSLGALGLIRAHTREAPS